MPALNGDSNGENSIAVTGTATGGGSIGVHGKGDAVGIRGDGGTWHGVVGFSEGGFGVYGEGLTGGSGVVGKSKGWHAVAGFSESTTGGFGVYGEGAGTGVAGVGKTWLGVYGETNAASAAGAAGVWGDGKEGGDGVKGLAKGQGKAGVAGFHLANKGPGIYGKGLPAGFFEGDVRITKDLHVNGFIYMGGDTVVPLSAWIDRVRHLEAQVADLRSRLPASASSSTPTAPSAVIGVELTPGTGTFSNFRVFGSGFLPNEAIEITVTSTTSTGGGGGSSNAATSDSLGRFSHTLGVSCPAGMKSVHTAFARGVASGRISNKASASC